MTTQLRRIEQSIGGPLFLRGRTGSRPTPLGRSVLSRARPIVAEMSALVDEARQAACGAGEDDRVRVGSTGSRAVPGWLRRIHDRLPETDTTIHMDVSAHTLLRMVADRQLDAVFVHEVEGSPLCFPDGLEQRVLVEREPQFVALPAGHPAVAREEVDLTELAADRWMVDPAVDGDWPGLRRVFSAAGLAPRVVHGDYLAAVDLVACGEVVTPCQPTSRPRPGMAVRPLRGDPLAVRLVMVTRAARAGTVAAERVDALFADLAAAYAEVAWASDPYRHWLRRHPDRVPGGLPLLLPVPA